MDDLYNKYFGGETEKNEPEAENANNVPETDAVNESVEGVQFNEDGTYHGVHNETESTGDTVNNSKSRASEAQNNVNGFAGQSYNNPYQYGSNPQGQYGYGQTGYNYYQNASAQSGNPYGANPYAGFSRNENYAYPENNSTTDTSKPKGKSPKIIGIVVAVLCVVLVGALVAIALVGNYTVQTDYPDEKVTEDNIPENAEEFVTSHSPVTGNDASSEGEMTPKTIYQNVLPSSVGVLVYNSSKSLATEGSGVFFQESSDGKYTYIITCAHVIKDVTGKIRVQTYDSKEYDAEVVGYDARTDIGVLRVETTGFKLAEIGDSTKISVGDYIYAIGNPGGVEFANSFTDGIVSALDRPVNSSDTGYTTECIQHTAAINPGNSGGALVNSFGQVIGINSMKIVADDYEGMGFSVPSSVFIEVVNEIMANGYVANRPMLGITYVPASAYSNYGMFVAVKGLPSGSIVIYSIYSDSNLNSVDVKKGDMIVSVNGIPLESASDLSELIEDSEVGDTITLGIVRINDDYSYEEFDVNVALVEDRGDSFVTEESTTSDYSGGYGNYGDAYEDFFNEYFENFFNESFGG